jgi:hypothetical protein
MQQNTGKAYYKTLTDSRFVGVSPKNGKYTRTNKIIRFLNCYWTTVQEIPLYFHTSKVDQWQDAFAMLLIGAEIKNKVDRLCS